jgi:hypothetical protein
MADRQLITAPDWSAVEREAGPAVRDAIRRLWFQVGQRGPTTDASLLALGAADAIRPVVVSQAYLGAANSGSSPTTVWTVTVPPNTLTKAGDALALYLTGSWAGNGNTKTVLAQLGSSTIQQLGPSAVNGNTWCIDARLVYANSTTATKLGAFVTYTSSAAWAAQGVPVGTITVDWTTALTITITLTGSSSNDVTLWWGSVSKLPITS